MKPFTGADFDDISQADPGNEVTLLIDGDVIAFTADSAVQRIFEDEFGFFSPFGFTRRISRSFS